VGSASEPGDFGDPPGKGRPGVEWKRPGGNFLCLIKKRSALAKRLGKGYHATPASEKTRGLAG